VVVSIVEVPILSRFEPLFHTSGALAVCRSLLVFTVDCLGALRPWKDSFRAEIVASKIQRDSHIWLSLSLEASPASPHSGVAYDCASAETKYSLRGSRSDVLALGACRH